MTCQRFTARHFLLHAVRIAMLAAILVLLRLQQLSSNKAPSTHPQQWATIAEKLERHFPDAVISRDGDVIPFTSDGEIMLHDAAGAPLGTALLTSPASDHILGFSGPTNVLLSLNAEQRVVGLDVITSGDTRDHVRQVTSHAPFMTALQGQTRKALPNTTIDAVSGATLTSIAIVESIHHRLGGTVTGESLRFPGPPSLENVRILFAAADSVDGLETASVWQVKDAQGMRLGSVLRTVPAADNVVGYQGPTETLVGFSRNGEAIGIAVGKSFDNEPYVGYVRDDDYFHKLFNGQSLEQMADLDWQSGEIEGVSGATMTSKAVVEGIARAGQHVRMERAQAADRKNTRSPLSIHDAGTILVVLWGTAMGLTRLRAMRRLRIGYQLLLIGYLGLTAGNFVSQAMLVGWAKHGIPWRAASGLTCLTLAACTLPILTQRNLYCTHLCPHGAAQQLLRNRIRNRRLPTSVSRFLSLAPALLLAWCVFVGTTTVGFSLVDIEPFDAYVFRVAGVATVTIALLGLVASLFVPMAYCRYGCPTGAILQYLRFHASSDRWTSRDWTAFALLALAAALYVVQV